MPSLGNAILTLRVKGDEFKAGLAKAKGQAETTTKGIGSAFGRAQKSIQGAAAKVPVFGGALAGLASPAGLAAAGIGLVVGGLTKMVTKTLAVGRALGEARERTGVATEAWQIYSRAVEETNGDAGSLERVVLRLSKSIGDANTGNKAAQQGFDRLGLSWEELAAVSPDEAMKRVIGAANESLSATDGASVKAALLGRSYTNLGGFANLTTAEITALTDSVAENAVTMSGDQVTAVDNFDSALRTLRDSVGGLTTGIGSALIPILTNVINFFNNDLLPPIKDIARVMGPVLMPILRAFANIFGGNIKTVLVVVADVLKFVSQVLTGDFAGAWQTVQHIAQTVMNGIIRVYNNTIGLIPGVSKIDMLAFADNIEIAEEAVKDLAVASGETATAIRETGTAAVETEKAVKDAAFEILKAERKLTRDLDAEGKKRLANAIAIHKEQAKARADAKAAEEQDLADRAAAYDEFLAQQLADTLKSFEITQAEYKRASVELLFLKDAERVALQNEANEYYEGDIALLLAHNRKIAEAKREAANDAKEIFREAHEFINANADAGFARYVGIIEKHLADGVVSAQEAAKLIAEALNRAQGAAAGAGRGGDRSGLTPGGLGYDAVSGGKGRKGGLDASQIESSLRNKAVGEWIRDRYSGGYWVKTREPNSSARRGDRSRTGYPRWASHVDDRPGDVPGAQHGAFVQGSRMGSLVRVGENFTDENITPVGSRGGGGSGSGQKMVIPVNLGGETLATIYVEGKRVAVREGRD